MARMKAGTAVAATNGLVDKSVIPEGVLDKEPEGSMFVGGQGMFRPTVALGSKGGRVNEPGELIEGEDWTAANMTAFLTRSGQAMDAVLTMPIRRLGWHLEPGKGDTGEAEDCEEKLRRAAANGGMSTPIGTVIGQQTAARLYRRSYHAKAWKLDDVKGDGSFMYSDVAWRPPENCTPRINPDGSFAGFYQRRAYVAPGDKGKVDPEGRVVFEPINALMHVNGRHRAPLTGVSDVEVAYWCWTIQSKLMILWGEFTEAAARPRTIVTPGQQDSNASKVLQFAKNLAASLGGGVIQAPAGATAQVFDVAGTASGVFLSLWNALETVATKSILAGFLDLPGAAAAGGGSYALSTDSTDFFLQATEAAAADIATTNENYLVAPLVRYNYGPKGVVPTWKFDTLDEIDMGPAMALLTSAAVGTTTSLSPEFLKQLELVVGGHLGMDQKQLAASIDQAQAEAKKAADAAAAARNQPAVPASVAQAAATVDTLRKAVGATP